MQLAILRSDGSLVNEDGSHNHDTIVSFVLPRQRLAVASLRECARHHATRTVASAIRSQFRSSTLVTRGNREPMQEQILSDLFNGFKQKDYEHDQKAKRFLDEYVFFDLDRCQVSFDVETIAHFRAESFLRVLDRCERYGIQVPGIEVFTGEGKLLLVEINQENSPMYFAPIVVRLCGMPHLSVCATYTVPESLVASPAVPEELLDAYLRTEYSIRNGESLFSVRVGRPSPDAEQLLKELKAVESFIITAANPFSRRLNAGANSFQNLLLEEKLELGEAALFASKSGRGTNWEEDGFLVVGLQFRAIQELGTMFGQNAAIRVPREGSAELILLR